MAVPESLDAKVENILDGLETEKKDSKNTDGKRVNQTVRHYGFRRIVIPAAACLLLASVTVTASGLYRARMESMNHEKLETYFSGLQEADVAADSYSRPLTDGEKNRLEELRQAYLEEGYFPKKELVMLDSPEKYKKGVAFYAARSIFFLPEEEMTDEDLLAKTGGIVQGMSGSPILQDGRLVGAVTHVLVNDPTCGYAIFADSMLEAGA